MLQEKLLMIPGPTPVAQRVLDKMARPTVAHGDKDFVADYKEVIEDLKKLFHVDGEAFVVAGSGTLAMEMGVANILQEGDSVLLISHGFFGARFVTICETKGYDVDVMEAEWGKIVPIENIVKKVSEKNYKAVIVTHVDTSTGVVAPVKEIAQALKGFEDTLLLVDGVCASAGICEDMSDGIDVIITGSQKAFGMPPGLAIVLASQRALDRRKSFDKMRDYYIDFARWAPVMENPAKYFGTPAVNLVWALQEALAIINEEGLEARYARHTKIGLAMQSAFEALGFKVLAEEGHRAPTLSCLAYMDGIDDVAFRTRLEEEGVMSAGGLAQFAGISFRLGHMGNISAHEMVGTISAVERTLYAMGVDVLGKGVRALELALAD